MLRAYFDESGVHQQSGVILFCGVVGTADQFAALEQDWQVNLDTIRVPYFHATDCESGEGKVFGSVKRELREALFTGQVNVLCKHKPSIIACAVLRRDWDTYKDLGLEDRFITPYHLCFENCMHDLMMWSDENAHSESVALVFADQKEYKSRVGTIYDLYAQPKTWGNRLSSLTFMQSSNCAALQAADLVAYECYRHMHSRLTDPEYENQPLRPRLRKMLDSGMDHRGRLNDNKLLEELLAQKHKRYL